VVWHGCVQIGCANISDHHVFSLACCNLCDGRTEVLLERCHRTDCRKRDGRRCWYSVFQRAHVQRLRGADHQHGPHTAAPTRPAFCRRFVCYVADFTMLLTNQYGIVSCGVVPYNVVSNNYLSNKQQKNIIVQHIN
jgi:hypothetical protein